MALRWVACSMTDGSVIDYLPTLEPSYPYRHTLSTFDTARAILMLENAPADWRQIVEPFTSWIAAYDDEDPDESPVWVGYVVDALLDASVDSVVLDLASAEAYAMRRFTRDATHHAGEDRNSIIAATVANYITDQPDKPGIPLTVETVVAGGTGPALTADLVWQNADNRTVFARWTELIGQFGGEFTVTWDWVIAPSGGKALAGTLLIGNRIGAAASRGLEPPVTFDMPGAIIRFQQLLDYSEGKGANVITAYSSGQGDSTPFAPDVVADDFNGRPTIEYRYQPAPSISPPAVEQYAREAIKILAPGAQPVTLQLAFDQLDGRRFGSDWKMGDDIGYNVQGVRQDGSKVLAFPDGVKNVGRVLAVELTSPTIITPILGIPTIYQQNGT